MTRHNVFHQIIREDAPEFVGDHDSTECVAPCTMRGCDHALREHTGDAMCIACFEFYGEDDSAVEGGVYHHFKG